MTYLLLQTFLLLLSSYFLGAFVACLAKRMLTARGIAIPATAGLAAPAVHAAPTVIQPAIAPRTYDPVQPKIDVFARPAPVPPPAQVDTSRFDRALAGATAATVATGATVATVATGVTTAAASTVSASAGSYKFAGHAPRRPVVEIRPAILKSPTAPASKLAPAAQTPAKPQPAPQPQSAPKPVSVAPPPAPAPVSTASAAAAAAAAAISAAKVAAASTSVPTVQPPRPAQAPSQLTPQQPNAAPTPAPEPKRPLAEPPRSVPPAASTQPAATQYVPVSFKGGDDFQRIRAIDEATEQRLKNFGVTRFEQMALWTAADINRVNQGLGLAGRIDTEQWIEQAQILAKGGETYYSRNRAGAAPKPAAAPQSPLPQAPQPMSTSTAAAAAAAAAAATVAARASAAPQAPSAPAPKPAAHAPTPAAPPAPPSSVKPVSPSGAASPAATSSAPQRSVADMATAAAAAFAAASASVTRGIRPIEPISPMSKADPNLSMPAKLQDAIREQEQKAGANAPPRQAYVRSVKEEPVGYSDDLKRVRGIGVLIEKRLNSLGITSYDQIANWTNADVDRISQTLDFKGRIERESWIEQARILSSGGDTEFSRRVDKGDVETSRE